MSKIVATTFCPTLENPDTLCCQIDRKGLVTISLYKDSRVPGSTTYFLAENLKFKIIGLRTCEFIVVGEKNDRENCRFIPTRLIFRGNRRLVFRVRFAESGETISVLKAQLIKHLVWLQDKRQSYLRKAA